MFINLNEYLTVRFNTYTFLYLEPFLFININFTYLKTYTESGLRANVTLLKCRKTKTFCYQCSIKLN